MTMLAILPGQPAKGERQPDSRDAQDYPNLTPQQREKLLAALQKRQPPKADLPAGSTRTEVSTLHVGVHDTPCLVSVPCL